MTHEELKKIFGDKLETIEFKPPVFDVPDVFDNVAVYVSRNLSNVIRREAKILPAKEVKCHGVIPMSKEYKEKYDKLPSHERPFNCCIGDYTEERHTIWIRGLEIKHFNNSEENKFKATHKLGMPDGYAVASCCIDDLNEWLPIYYANERMPFGYVGFFNDAAKAYAAVKAKFAEKQTELLDLQNHFHVYEDIADQLFNS